MKTIRNLAIAFMLSLMPILCTAQDFQVNFQSSQAHCMTGGCGTFPYSITATQHVPCGQAPWAPCGVQATVTGKVTFSGGVTVTNTVRGASGSDLLFPDQFTDSNNSCDAITNSCAAFTWTYEVFYPTHVMPWLPPVGYHWQLENNAYTRFVQASGQPDQVGVFNGQNVYAYPVIPSCTNAFIPDFWTETVNDTSPQAGWDVTNLSCVRSVNEQTNGLGFWHCSVPHSNGYFYESQSPLSSPVTPSQSCTSNPDTPDKLALSQVYTQPYGTSVIIKSVEIPGGWYAEAKCGYKYACSGLTTPVCPRTDIVVEWEAINIDPYAARVAAEAGALTKCENNFHAWSQYDPAVGAASCQPGPVDNWDGPLPQPCD